jgi:hypothetical protein
MMLYHDTPYKLQLVFENMGSAPASVSFVWTFEGASGSGNLSVPGKDEKTETVTVRCPAITEDYESKPLSFTITSGGVTWEDRLTLRFSREAVTFTIRNRTGGPLSGAIISPAGKTIGFETTPIDVRYPNNYSWGAEVVLPKWKNAEYLVGFLGAYGGNGPRDAHYSLGVGAVPPSGSEGWATLPETQYDTDEENDTEETAKPFEVSDSGPDSQKRFVSYIRKGNLDYFKVRITD